MTAAVRFGACVVTMATALAVAGCGRSASWSPTGREIAVDVGGKLHLFDVESGTVSFLATGGRYAVNPTFSPDGTRIAYFGITQSSDGTGTCDLWLREASASWESDRKVAGDVFPLRRESPSAAAARIRPVLTLAWSPDGQKLAYVRMVEDRGAIEVLNLNSAGVTRLGRRGEAQLAPAWSPSGRRLAYLAETHARLADPGVSFDLCVTDFGSAGRETQTWDIPAHREIWPYWPIAWSKDGAGVLVLEQRTGSPTFEVRLVRPNGSQLIVGGLDTPLATITPDFSAIVSMGSTEGGDVLYSEAPFDRKRVLDRIPSVHWETKGELTLPAAVPYPMISSDGRFVALPLGNDHTEIRLYEVATGHKRTYPIP